MSTNQNINGLMAGVIDFTAGSIGAMAGSLVGFPLDTIKLKVQTYPHLYKNNFDCFRKTLRKEGFRGFYRGILPGMWADIAEKSVLFCSYGFCQRMVCRYRDHQKPSILDNALAGFFAAFFSTIAMSPIDLIKVRLQALSERGLRPGITSFQMILKIMEEEGFRGFYRGFNSTLVREMPGFFFYFGGYGLAKEFLKIEEEDQKLSLIKTSLAGGFGGVCLWLAVYPIDVVKSRIQVDYNSQYIFTVLLKIIRKDGIAGLYRGLTPTLIRTFPSAGALFVAYEETKIFLTKAIDKRDS